MNRIETTATLLAPAATALRTSATPLSGVAAEAAEVAYATATAAADVADVGTAAVQYAAALTIATAGYVPGPGASVSTTIPGHLPARGLLRIRHAVR